MIIWLELNLIKFDVWNSENFLHKEARVLFCIYQQKSKPEVKLYVLQQIARYVTYSNHTETVRTDMYHHPPFSSHIHTESLVLNTG